MTALLTDVETGTETEEVLITSSPIERTRDRHAVSSADDGDDGGADGGDDDGGADDGGADDGGADD